MTIEEAIEHCRDYAMKQKAKADKYTKNYLMYAAKGCEECAAEHEQLAEWLTELKQRRDADIAAPPKTNSDRIRQMTDEELAKILCFAECEVLCPADHEHCNGDCCGHFIRWLKQDATDTNVGCKGGADNDSE